MQSADTSMHKDAIRARMRRMCRGSCARRAPLERSAIDLSNPDFRQRTEYNDAGGHACARKLGPDLVLYGARLHRGTIAGHDERDRHLPEIRVRGAHDAAGTHRRVAQYRFLDASGRQVLAAANDDLLQPAADGQITVPVEPAKVAGAQPPVADRRSVPVTGRRNITFHERGPGDADLAFRTGRDRRLIAGREYRYTL